jgi:hypothetical protein
MEEGNTDFIGVSVRADETAALKSGENWNM